MGRTRWLVVAATGMLLAWPVVAPAALPDRGARFEVHDHSVPGAGWHVELQVGRTRTRLRSVVLYDERCGETIFEQKVKISRDGTVDRAGSFTSTEAPSEEGQWSLHAVFTTRHRVEGSFQITRPGCDTGARAFAAEHDRRGRQHGGHHHGRVGYADVGSATPAARAEARRMLRRVRRVARRQFPSYRAARRQGFRTGHRLRRFPGISHAKHSRYITDGRILDARRPESLVYWRTRSGRRILLAFMFKAPAGPRPAFAGTIPVWHRHERNGHLGDDQMTHVWLTRGIRAGFANCMPVPELEAANPRFHFTRPARARKEPDSSPCPQTTRSEER
jgi:hypothetical protein